MTDTERRALSERIAILAEHAGLSAELLWEAAETCPQGHENEDGIIGEICYMCTVDENIIPDSYWPASRAYRAHEWRTDWHPEWRIGKQAKDLTDPSNLLPLVKAWIGQQPDDEGWTYQIAWCDGQAVGNLYEVVDQDWGRHYDGDDAESEWVALALAFAEALEKGVES